MRPAEIFPSRRERTDVTSAGGVAADRSSTTHRFPSSLGTTAVTWIGRCSGARTWWRAALASAGPLGSSSVRGVHQRTSGVQAAETASRSPASQAAVTLSTRLRARALAPSICGLLVGCDGVPTLACGSDRRLVSRNDIASGATTRSMLGCRSGPRSGV